LDKRTLSYGPCLSPKQLIIAITIALMLQVEN
jgi:hypothetical protein